MTALINPKKRKYWPKLNFLQVKKQLIVNKSMICRMIIAGKLAKLCCIDCNSERNVIIDAPKLASVINTGPFDLTDNDSNDINLKKRKENTRNNNNNQIIKKYAKTPTKTKNSCMYTLPIELMFRMGASRCQLHPPSSNIGLLMRSLCVSVFLSFC